MDLSGYRFLKSHEWALLAGDIVTVGISQFAVEQLTDVTNVELPKVGKVVKTGKPFGEIESVKAVFDLNSPCDGEIIEVNEWLKDHLVTITEEPYTKGWMVKIKLVAGATLDHLMNLPAYEKQLASEGH